MITSSIARSLTLVALLALLGAVAAPSQRAAEQEQEPLDTVFVETVDVDVVNLEVFVTDKQGNRVTDLTRDDFEIYEDGRPVSISNFYRVASRRRAPVLEAPAPEDPEPAPPPMEKLEAPPEQRLRLVVYIDNDNVDPLNRNRLFKHLRTFLGTNLEPGDEVSIYTYERALHLRLPFTEDLGAAFEMFHELARISGRGNSKRDARRDLLREIDRAKSRFDVDARVRVFARETLTDVEFTIDALGQMVSSLAGLPGRKAVLYVSDGIPLRAAEDLFEAMAERFQDPSIVVDAFTYDASRKFTELSARANANQVTFYTIQAAGLRAHGDAGADVALSHSYGRVNNLRRLNFAAPLVSLADETGGISITGTSNFTGGLARVADDFGGYYSLGYMPAHGGDGRYYKVEVEVKRKGLNVRHREGYRAKTPRVKMSEQTMAALRYDEVVSNPLDIRLEVEAARLGEQKLYSVPVVVRVPIAKIALIPRDDQHVGRLKLFLAAIDEEGRLVSVDDQPWSVEVPEGELEKAQAMTFAHQVTLTMRAGRHRIAVGVRDEIAAEKSFVTQRLFLGG